MSPLLSLLCFVYVVAGRWALFSITKCLVSIALKVVITLGTTVVLWPWYVFGLMTQLSGIVLFIATRLITLLVIRPCCVVWQLCLLFPLYYIYKIVRAIFKQRAVLLWLAKVVGPVVGVVSLVHISLECSVQESFKVQISQCASDASCLLLVQCRFNCSALWLRTRQ